MGSSGERREEMECVFVFCYLFFYFFNICVIEVNGEYTDGQSVNF